MNGGILLRHCGLRIWCCHCSDNIVTAMTWVTALLSLQWHESLLWHGFSPWCRDSHMLWVWQKKKKKKERLQVDFLSCLNGIKVYFLWINLFDQAHSRQEIREKFGGSYTEKKSYTINPWRRSISWIILNLVFRRKIV